MQTFIILCWAAVVGISTVEGACCRGKMFTDVAIKCLDCTRIDPYCALAGKGNIFGCDCDECKHCRNDDCSCPNGSRWASNAFSISLVVYFN